MNFLIFKNTLGQIPVFSIQDIGIFFPNFDSRRLIEWQEKGYIQKIRNRYYRFKNSEIGLADRFHIANKIYSPSYVSLESALSFYGIIPEGVFQTTSCTTRKTQTFNTEVSSFSYRNMKRELFIGYRIEESKVGNYLIASAEKAIIDYLYLHSEIKTMEDFESLRWNQFEIERTVSFEKLDTYCKYVGSNALSKRIKLLKAYMYAWA